MPTETFQIPYTIDYPFPSGAPAYHKLLSTEAHYTVDIIEVLRSVLTAAGWSIYQSLEAQVSFDLPWGLPYYVPRTPTPTPGALDHEVYPFWGVDFYGVTKIFKLYDPELYLQPADTDTVFWVAMGTSHAATINNWVAKINAVTVWNVHSANLLEGKITDTWWRVNLIAKVSGPLYNASEGGGGSSFPHTNLSWMDIPDGAYGGGYLMRSADCYGMYVKTLIMGAPRAEGYHVFVGFPRDIEEIAMHSLVKQLAGDFGEEAEHGVPNTGPPTIVAGPFHFFIWREDKVDEEGFVVPVPAEMKTEIFCAMPRPEIEHDVTFAHLVMLNDWRDRLSWGNRGGGLTRWSVRGMSPVFSATDLYIPGITAPPNYPGAFPRMHCFKAVEGSPLVTSQQHPIILPSYLALPTGVNPFVTGQATLVGKLWDSLILSQWAALNSRMLYDGREWICIASSKDAYTQNTSLWILI